MHAVYTVSAGAALPRGLRLHPDLDVVVCPWPNVMKLWGEEPIRAPFPNVRAIWLDLPADIPTPVNVFWHALTNLVSAAVSREMLVVVTVKHADHRNGVWNYQTFRKWRRQFPFRHSKHCFCMCGVQNHHTKFHWKINCLDLNLGLRSKGCSHWNEGDSHLSAKDA